MTEGFASAWESDPDGFGSTMVHFKILNVPSGVHLHLAGSGNTTMPRTTLKSG